MADEKLSRGDYLLTRILARLGINQRQESKVIAPRFALPWGPASVGQTAKATRVLSALGVSQILTSNVHRVSILISSPSTGSARVWVNGTDVAAAGFVVPADGYLEFTRQSHGDLVIGDWWVTGNPGAQTFGIIEIF